MPHARPGTTCRRAAQSLTRLRLLLLLLAAASCLALAPAVRPQSGRRKPPPLSPAPTPEPTPEEQGESESEGRPKRSGPAQLSFNVHRLDEAFPYIDHVVEETVMEAFMQRLTRNKDLSASRGQRITLHDARARAKGEPDSYIVVVEFDEDPLDGMGRRPTNDPNRGDTRTLGIKAYVYEPKTGALKYVVQTSQRPYQQSTTIGGVRLPLPVPTRRMERFPNELQLEQAARDAADRIMLKFNLRLPPD